MKPAMDNDREIEVLYREFKAEFLRNTSRYPLTEEQRIDIYQDAFVAMYEMLKYRENPVTKDFKNYLFGIGRNMIKDKIKSEIRERRLKEELVISTADKKFSPPELGDLNPLQEQIHAAIRELSESCRKILVLFYFRQYSIDAIMHSMNYRNENVTKSHKSRCLKRLKELMLNVKNQ
ncbi:MAG: sigma-70 family RNA polymerase sigma factor [Saprospiraceae bacterium]|nr:sigma-70 family RNA polymerase sigma factor [Saprospiraceae bacterium]